MIKVRGEPWRKRLFDVVGAAGGLIAFSPVMAVITVAILLDEAGRSSSVRSGWAERGCRSTSSSSAP